MYHDNSVVLEVGGANLTIVQSTDYPWDGRVKLQVQTKQPIQFDMALRIPDWCYDYQLSINGDAQNGIVEKGYGSCRVSGRMGTRSS